MSPSEMCSNEDTTLQVVRKDSSVIKEYSYGSIRFKRAICVSASFPKKNMLAAIACISSTPESTVLRISGICF